MQHPQSILVTSAIYRAKQSCTDSSYLCSKKILSHPGISFSRSCDAGKITNHSSDFSIFQCDFHPVASYVLRSNPPAAM